VSRRVFCHPGRLIAAALNRVIANRACPRQDTAACHATGAALGAKKHCQGACLAVSADAKHMEFTVADRDIRFKSLCCLREVMNFAIFPQRGPRNGAAEVRIWPTEGWPNITLTN
jgi:hypothetical protein